MALLDYYEHRVGELAEKDVHFHTIGETCESFISFFSKTKFKLYEKSKEYLDFIGGQVHLLFANSSERSMVLIQTRKQLMDELDHRAKSRKVSFCPSPAANRKQRWDNGLELKEKIKDELRNVLETSVNSPHLNQNSPHRNRFKMEKWASMKEISKDQIYSKVKRSNSMINLGQNQPRKYSIENDELKRFFSKKLPAQIPGSGGAIDQSDNDLIEFFNWVGRKSEIQFRLATPGGESYIQRPIRILHSWLQYDAEAQQIGQPENLLNLHHLQLSVLAADLRFKKILSQSILELNRRLTKKATDELLPRDPPKPRDLEQQLEPITFSLPPPEVNTAPLPVVSNPIEVRTGNEVEITQTNQKPASPPPTPLPEISVQSKPEKILQPTQIQSDQPILLTQQMALLTQMVSLMQQNMMQNSQQNFQHNTQRSQSQNSHQRTFTARNPVFPKNVEKSKKSISNFGIPLFERSKSHQPIKNVIRKPSFTRSQSTTGVQLRSSGSKKFQLLEVGKSEYQPTGSAENIAGQDRKSDRKFTFINPTKVKGHIKTKNKQKMIKLDRFLEAPIGGGAKSNSGKRVVSPRNDFYPKHYPSGPSEMLKREDKENIPENHKNISNQNIDHKKNLVLIDSDEIDRKEFLLCTN